MHAIRWVTPVRMGLLTLIIFTLTSPFSWAATTGQPGPWGNPQPQRGTWGGNTGGHRGELSVGLATPSPTGVSLKYWTTRTKAYNFFAEWNFGDKKVNAHFDYLTHDFNQVSMDDADTPVYFGFGARVVEEEDEDTITGIRFPIGVSYLSRSTPFDLFAEAAPRVNLTPSTNFGVDLQIGVRFRLFHK